MGLHLASSQHIFSAPIDIAGFILVLHFIFGYLEVRAYMQVLTCKSQCYFYSQWHFDKCVCKANGAYFSIRLLPDESSCHQTIFMSLKIIFPRSGLIYTQALFSSFNPFYLKLQQISEHILWDAVHLWGLQEHFQKLHGGAKKSESVWTTQQVFCFGEVLVVNNSFK